MTAVTAKRAMDGYLLDPDEGEAYWLLGMLQTIKIGRDDTDGQYGLLEIVVPEGVGSPWHVHPEEDEWFYVLEGEITFWIADKRLSLTAGSFAFGPKGVPHTFYAEAGGAKALVGFAPMQFEGFQRAVGEPAPEQEERVRGYTEGLAAHGIVAPPQIEVRMTCVIEEGAVFFDFMKPDPARRGWYAFAPAAAHRYQAKAIEDYSHAFETHHNLDRGELTLHHVLLAA